MTSKSANKVTVSKKDLAEAGRAVGLGTVQTDRMWELLTAGGAAPSQSSFGGAQVLWYFGAAVVLVAMGWLIAIVGSSYGSGATLATSLIYTAAFTFAGWKLASERDLRVPGGLLYALAVVMTPVTVTAAAETWQVGARFDDVTLWSALATAAVGVVYTLRTRISFVVLPALIAGWVAVLQWADWSLFGTGRGIAEWLTVAYGAALVLGSIFAESGRGANADEDYSFWGYLVGAAAVFFGLAFVDKGEPGYLLFAAYGVASMLFSVVVNRRVFAFAGAAAVLTYLGHISIVFFANSALFPLVLTIIGIGTIYGGVLYHRHSDKIDAAILSLIPAGLRNRLPGR